MKISDVVANYILEMLEESGGRAEIQRNELAQHLGCVPSQINYVITSRFTPEQGFLVESRRGGGGYIRITQVSVSRSSILMHVVNSVGDSLDPATARAMLSNLSGRAVSPPAAHLIAVAINDRSLGAAPTGMRERIRAAIFKNMLLTQI